MRENLIIESLKYTINEHRDNKAHIFKIARENMQQQTLRTSLGIGWVFFRDIIYFTVFIVFRYLMAGNGQIEGMHFTLFLMLGMIPWNFMNECINGGVNAVKQSKSMLSAIKYPITTLPTIEIIAIFLKRMFTLIILFVVIFIYGDLADVTWWMFIYYFIAMFVFMVIWNLIFSSLVAISNDFEQLYRAITSVIFFAMPIMWSFEVIKDYPGIIRLFKLNPFVYIINGFREACASGKLPDLEFSIYFWGFCLVLFCIGSILQYKLRRHYVDLI